MKKELITYTGIVWLALGAAGCTRELTPDAGSGKEQGPLLTVRAGLRSAAAANRDIDATGRDIDESAYKAFPAGRQIRIYYAHNNLDQAYDFLQGIYQAPGGDDKTAPWTAQAWRPAPGSEPVKSIYLEDIKAPNSNGRYFFTATSYPEPRVSGGQECIYEVAPDQTVLDAGFGTYDFLAARAIYDDAAWKEGGEGITLHFRHLLSQLRVQLILPKGSTADGFFPDPAHAVLDATLAGKHYRYTVTYNNRTLAGGIFGIGLPSGGVEDIRMHSDGVTGPVTVNGREAYCHTFSAILPKQTLYGGKQLLFTLDGAAYSYTPPTANTVLLEQEKITTIQLTVLSGPGNQKVMLNKVTLEDWLDDKADVGDLIPQ